MKVDLNLEHQAALPRYRGYKIGVIGAGFIVRDVQLPAYQNAGYHVEAITAQDVAQARETAALRSIAKVYETHAGLLNDEAIEVLDIAVPPTVQPGIIRDVLEHAGHIKGILAQKPLAMNYKDAVEIVRRCEAAGITLAVNQNMRYDQSIRALKTILNRGYLGQPVLATIEMRAIPHWQAWLHELDRLTLLNMSIHHLDCFRFLFGDPDSVYASVRTDPRTAFAHRDGIALYILEYANGFRASAWDDVWTGPAREGAAPDTYIRWRVEGTDGMALGTIGWPSYPAVQPSTIEFTTKLHPGEWFRPTWPQAWFPDAFEGTMGMLFGALNDGALPAVSGRDNLNTMALIDACYLSIEEHRPVALHEIKDDSL